MGGIVSTPLASNAQTVQIHEQLTCLPTDPTANAIPAVFSLSAIAPVTGGSGQDISYSDLKGSFMLDPFRSPPFVNSNTTNWQLDIAAEFTPTNTAPSFLTVRGSTPDIAGWPYPPPVFDFAQASAGPLTLGTAGKSSHLQLESVTARVTTTPPADANGVRTPVLLEYTCFSIGGAGLGQNNAAALTVLASTAVAAQRQTLSNAGPATAGRSDLEWGTKATRANVPLSCNGPSGAVDGLGLVLAGAVPTRATVGSAFNISSLEAELILPASLVQTLARPAADNPAYADISVEVLALALQPNATVAGPSSREAGLAGSSAAARVAVMDWMSPLTLTLGRSVSVGLFTVVEQGRGGWFGVEGVAFEANVGAKGGAASRLSCTAASQVEIFSVPVSW